MKLKTKHSIAAFIAGVMLPLFIYWVAGNEFVRCHDLAFTVSLSSLTGGMGICLVQIVYNTNDL